jgi:hypothetical protein
MHQRDVFVDHLVFVDEDFDAGTVDQFAADL